MKVLIRIGALLGLFFGLAVSVNAMPLAAITWSFTDITTELTGLGTALLAVIGVVIGGVLAFWGVKRSIKPILAIVGKLMG